MKVGRKRTLLIFHQKCLQNAHHRLFGDISAQVNAVGVFHWAVVDQVASIRSSPEVVLKHLQHDPHCYSQFAPWYTMHTVFFCVIATSEGLTAYAE